MNLKKLFATSAVFAVLASVVAPVATYASTSYDTEVTGAYNYAYGKNVTTMPSIEAATPYGKAIRGHVAKMISNWALDVMGTTPVESVFASFSDISTMSEEIQGYIIKSAQQGLMGQNTTAFRPLDNISRGEFATVLSRALYGDKYDGGTPYYANHMQALKDAGIMNNISNPNISILRYEIWLMLQRADAASKVDTEGTTDTSGLSFDQLMACLADMDNFDTCVAEAKGEDVDEDETDVDDDVDVEDEDEDTGVVKSGEVSVKLSKSTPDERIPVGISRVPMTKFVVSAGDEDIKLYSITVDNMGLGDPGNIKEVAIYNEDNVEVSKSSKDFGSKEDISINFVKDLTVKADGSETFTVVAMMTGDDSTTYGLKITELSSSAKDVDGLPVKGEIMDTINATNIAKVEINGGTEGGKLEAGEEKTLASFKIEELDNGDAELLSVKLTLVGDARKDVEFDNLTLYADGDEVKDAKFDRNASDELTITMDYKIEQDEKVEFKVKGSVAELADAGESFRFEIASASDIYVKDIDKGYNAKVTLGGTPEYISNNWTTEGAEITASFKRADRDEVKDDSDDVLFGTLTLKSNGTNYTLEDYKVKVTVSSTVTGGVKSVVDDLQLNGSSYDKVTGDATTTAYYNFDEIDLRANETVKLPIVLDIAKDLANNIDITVDADLTGSLVNEDDDEDVAASAFNGTFSSTNFSSKTITIEQPTLTFSKKTLNDRDIILGNQDEVAYKAKISIGDADDVKLKDIAFTMNSIAGTADLDELVQGATLTIGGDEYSEDDVTATKISFSSINHKFDAGKSNVDVYLTVQMKSKDGYTGTIAFTPDLGNVEAEDLDGDDVTVSPSTGVQGPKLVLADHGTLTMSTYLTDENGTVESQSVQYDKSVVAGSENKVVLGKIKLKAEREAMKIKELTFTGNDVTAKFEDSVVDFSLSIGSGDNLGAYKASNTSDVLELKFENIDYTLEEGKVEYATVYAKIKDLDLDTSAVDSAKLGAELTGMKLTAIEYEGKDSGDDETEITTTLPTDAMKNTTVVASNIATVELVKNETTLVNGANHVATLKITATNAKNVDADGDVIYPYLKDLASQITFKGTAGVDGTPTLAGLEKIGGTVAMTGIANLGDDREIEGTVSFRIYADVTLATGADSDTALTTELLDATDVVFTQGDPAITELNKDFNWFAPKGASKKFTVTTK